MNKILELRRQKNMAQIDLAKFLGVTPQAVSLYEKWPNKGGREPKLETWKKLAEYFDVSVPYLQGLTDEKTSLVHTISDFVSSDVGQKALKQNQNEEMLREVFQSQGNFSYLLDEDVLSPQDRKDFDDAMKGIYQFALSMDTNHKSEKEQFTSLMKSISAATKVFSDNRGQKNYVTNNLEYLLKQVIALKDEQIQNKKATDD